MADFSLAVRWTYVAQTTAEYSQANQKSTGGNGIYVRFIRVIFAREDGSRHRDKDFTMLQMVDMLGLLDDN